MCRRTSCRLGPQVNAEGQPLLEAVGFALQGVRIVIRGPGVSRVESARTEPAVERAARSHRLPDRAACRRAAFGRQRGRDGKDRNKSPRVDAIPGMDHRSAVPSAVTTRTLPRVDEVKRDGFSWAPHVRGDVLLIRLHGNGEKDALPSIDACLKEAQTEALRLAVSQLRFDFSEVRLLCSACFRAFVSWLLPLSRMAAPPFRIVLVGNPKLSWQGRSLNSLRYLAPGLVTLEVAGTM